MLRAPVDSNVLVSGMLSPFENSSSFQVLKCILQGRFHFLSSESTQKELERVLRSERFRIKLTQRSISIPDVCRDLKKMSEQMEPVGVVLPVVVRDITDRIFLELALAADADYFVTNDHRHLGFLKKIGRTKIVTPHKFMQALKQSM